MIYSINEGVLNNSKKGNTTKSEFNNILDSLKKLIRSLESNESKFAASNKGLKRVREHENNDIEKIKTDFLSGKSSFIVYHMSFEIESGNKDSKIDNKQAVVNAVKQFATSNGFKNIDLKQNHDIYLDARNSEKYPTLIIQLTIFKHPKRGEMIDIGLFSDRNTCKLAKETTNESNVILKATDADSFLESYGITLFTDAIAIGEMVMDGITGEKILAENGITLNEDHIVLEGQQAEEYKARKARETEAKKKAEKERTEKRYKNDTVGDKKKNVVKDLDRAISAGIDSIDRMSARGIKNPYEHKDFKVVNDTTNRHMRRHPKQYKESAIFKYSNK